MLASGTGSLLEAILAHGLDVTAVGVDRPCRALEVARRAGLAVVRVDRNHFGPSFDRARYSRELAERLLAEGVQVVAMAGFGTVLGAPFFETYRGRVLNTHPALLPAFKGWHAVADALAAGVKVTGTTVHVATEEVDDGPILAQEPVRVLPGDTEASLHERIKEVERVLYPATIRSFLEALAYKEASKEPKQ